MRQRIKSHPALEWEPIEDHPKLARLVLEDADGTVASMPVRRETLSDKDRLDHLQTRLYVQLAVRRAA